jgi:NADH:ubiquinone oxidoreductase subunit 6 (subunit J)
MKSSFEPQFETQFEPLSNDSAAFAFAAQEGAVMGARASVVNRTHRVVRERAKSLHERRSKARSLMIPLIVCASLLLLTCFAVWSGLYQYQAAEAAEAVQTDVAALAATDANNQYLVVLLWFVPVTLALLGAVWFRRTRNSTDREIL